MTALSAQDIIDLLGLQRHPEGGWYAETFRDTATEAGRARSTAIYFLLEAGETSQWHKVDAVEIWHFHAGAPLELAISDGTVIERHVLGHALAEDERPQGVVPEGAWQSARSLGAWTLVGCTVSPGFSFDGFELAPAGWAPTGG